MNNEDTMSEKLTRIDSAVDRIRVATDTVGDLIEDVATAVENSKPLLEKDVNFYDYDGTLLYAYTSAEVQNLTELPTPPAHAGLTFQEWNWSLADIKAETGEIEVGATYITSDGKTKIYLNLTDGILNPTIRIIPTGSVEVDWGDGSATELFEGTNNQQVSKTHTYSMGGKYIISLNPIDDSMFRFPSGSTYFIYSAGNPQLQQTYLNTVEKIHLGRNGSLGYQGNVAGFGNYFGLKEIIMHNSITHVGSFMYCNNLKVLIIPKSAVSIGTLAYSGVEKIIFGNITASVPSNFLSYSSVKKINFGANITLSGSVGYPNTLEEAYIRGQNGYQEFYECRNLKRVRGYFASTIASDMFVNCTKLQEIPSLNGVTQITSNVFNQVKVKIFDLGSSLQTIGNYAFSGCSLIEELSFPSTITTIGSSSSQSPFAGCYMLSVLDFSQCNAVPTLNTTIPTEALAKIIVPDALYEDWIVASGWSDYLSYIVKASEV